MNDCYNKNSTISTPYGQAQTPSGVAYGNAPVCINADGSTSNRAGIGFHNITRNGAYLYLDVDNCLYLINNGGGKYKLEMTAVQ